MEFRLNRTLLLFIMAILPVFTIAATEEANQAQAKAVMGNVYESYVKIIPYVYSSKNKLNDFRNKSKSKSKSKKEKAELLKNLTDLSQFFSSAKHAEVFQRPGFRPSLDTIKDHLEETIISVESNNYVFAQKRLNVIGALCVSCHSQLPESVSQKAFGDNIKKEPRERFDSDFSYANYLYLVRRFDDSKKAFEKAINEALDNRGTGNYKEAVNSLREIVSIDTKIKFNYDAAKAFIDKWEKDTRLNVNDKKMIKRWGDDINNWKGFNPASIKSMSDFMAKHLAPLDMKKSIIFIGENDMTLLIASGVILNYLVENPDTTLAPEILYWLSLVEHRLSQTYFYSLGDLYLKDCIKKYPSSPYAKKCYQEYAESIEAGYSGSAGTDIPADEKRELKKLKSLLKP